MTLTQQRLIFSDEADAIAYWRGREIKTWAVDVQAGPARRPSYRQTVYVRARTGTAVAEVAQREIYPAPPRSAQWRSRLADKRAPFARIDATSNSASCNGRRLIRSMRSATTTSPG